MQPAFHWARCHSISHSITRIKTLSSAEVSFVFLVRWEMGKGEIKLAGAWGKENENARGTLPIVPCAPRVFNFPIFSLFSPFSRRFSTEGASAEERENNNKMENLGAHWQRSPAYLGVLLSANWSAWISTVPKEMGGDFLKTSCLFRPERILKITLFTNLPRRPRWATPEHVVPHGDGNFPSKPAGNHPRCYSKKYSEASSFSSGNKINKKYIAR